MESTIKSKIENFCAYQERCHQDVINKLNKLGVFGDEVDEYICYLIDEKFLSETRFTEAFVRGKFNINNWGKVKIKNELKAKKISDWNIANALNLIDDKEYSQKLMSLCMREIGKELKIDIKSREKIIRRLSYKGWEVDKVIEFINQLTK